MASGPAPSMSDGGSGVPNQIVGGGSHREAPPGPAGLPLLGNVLQLRGDQLAYFSGAWRKYGDIVGMRVGRTPFLLLVHPDYVSRILHENHRNYTKQNFDYRLLQRLVGQGLLTADGDLWLRQRRMLQPLFHRDKVAAFGPLMTTAAQEMLARWDDAARGGEVLDVAAEMMRLTLLIIGRAMFGMDLAEETARVGQAFSIVNELLFDYGVVTFMPWLPVSKNRQVKAALAELDSVVRGIIERRRRDPQPRQDLVSLLLAARDEQGMGMDDKLIRDQVLTILLAGHETTANALAWTWYLLALHPEAEARFHDELERVLGGRVPVSEDLPRLTYTRMVLEESMRLRPPAWIFSRHAAHDDEIGGYRVAANSGIVLCSYLTHRHPDFWPDAERFDPERFAPGREEARPRYAYFPFGGGPRLCIGAPFAMVEAQLLLATIGQRYRLRMATDKPVEPQPLITLRPAGGLPMRLVARTR